MENDNKINSSRILRLFLVVGSCMAIFVALWWFIARDETPEVIKNSVGRNLDPGSSQELDRSQGASYDQVKNVSGTTTYAQSADKDCPLESCDQAESGFVESVVGGVITVLVDTQEGDLLTEGIRREVVLTESSIVRHFDLEKDEYLNEVNISAGDYVTIGSDKSGNSVLTIITYKK